MEVTKCLVEEDPAQEEALDQDVALLARPDPQRGGKFAAP